MLHEVILALSGHPSPLFASPKDLANGLSKDGVPLLSPSEQVLLQQIGRLSELHRTLKKHLDVIASTHGSVICRAVATSLQQTHLGRFQQKILQVESKILTKDASMVGAYEVVPLAAIVAEFDDWHRLMQWYWEMANLMTSARDMQISQNDQCSGARLIDRLRAETQTGYPEIESAATELARVAETAWLRQLSGWLVNGKLPLYGAADFFISSHEIKGQQHFASNRDLLPGFADATACASILFVGKVLNQVQHHRRLSQAHSSLSSIDGSELATTHLKHLSSLSLPIASAPFTRAIANIRSSLSQNVLQHLLPMDATLQLLACLRQFFLLDRGEFATALITEAERRVETRQRNMGSLLAKDPVKALQGLSLKDAELQQVMQHVWRLLLAEDIQSEDKTLEFARTNVSLVNPKANTSRPSSSDSAGVQVPDLSPVSFNNLLFPNPTEVNLNISSPMNLFLSPQDVQTYSAISSYLLAISRSHQRLSDMWKHTAARRDHPLKSLEPSGMRERAKRRALATRKVWATCSAAIFLLSETAAFFGGEVVQQSCDHFQKWVEKPQQDLSNSTTRNNSSSTTRPIQRDPETLAAGHRIFLASLTYALLLTDISYTKSLRSLLGNIDNLIAYFTRLLNIQQKLDIEHQAGGESAYTSEEEQKISLELDRARKKVDSDLRSVIARLRLLDMERVGSMRFLEVGRVAERGEFEVWKGGGVDRLLMKLEFTRMRVGGEGVV